MRSEQYDEWEIYPGDSLVRKIYDAGIGAAQAVLIVLSRNSVDKPMENGSGFGIQTSEMLSQATQQDISPYQFYESLSVLGDSHYLELTRSSFPEPSDPKLREMVRGGVPFFSLTIDGFEKYAKA